MDTGITLMSATGEEFSSLVNTDENKPESAIVEVPETLLKVNDDGTVISEIVEPIQNEDDKTPEAVGAKKVEKPAAPQAPKTPKKAEAADEEFYQALGEKLSQWGLLSDYDPEKFKSLDSFKSQLEEEKEAYHKRKEAELLERMSPKQRKYLELSQEGLAEDVVENIVERLETFKSITGEELSTDKDLAKSVYLERLRQAGFTEAKAKKYVEIAEESNSLVEEAEESLEALIATEEANMEKEKVKLVERRKKADEAAAEEKTKLEEAVLKASEFIPGIPVNDKIRQAVFDSITKEAGKTKNGQPYNKVGKISQSNPTGFQALMHYYVHLGLFDQDSKGSFTPNLSKITNHVTTKVVNQIDSEDKVRRGLFKTSSDGEAPDGDETLIERIRRLKNQQS